MSIDKKFLKEEGHRLIEAIEEAQLAGMNGDYDKAIEKYEEARIFAQTMMQKDIQIATALKINTILLAAEGGIIKAYLFKAKQEPEKEQEYEWKMEEVARGKISMGNPYFGKIIEAMEQLKIGLYS